MKYHLLFVSLILILLALPAAAEFQLTDFGADPTGRADSSDALQTALWTLYDAHGGTLVVPEGTFRLDKPVVIDFQGQTVASAVVIRGEGSSSIFRVNVGDGCTAVKIQNAGSVLLENLTFVGGTTKTDAHIAIALEYCAQARIRRCDFYGVASYETTGGAVVHASHTNLAIEAASFRGCTGSSGLGNPVVRVNDWIGLSITETDFIDFGTLNGVYYSKTPLSSAYAWVLVQDPTPIGVLGQNEVVLRRVQFDEGSYYGIAIQPTKGRVAHVTLSGLRVNGWNGSEDLGSGVYITKADEVQIRTSWFGWASRSKAAITLSDVGNAEIDSVICDIEKGMSKIRVTDTDHLTIRNSVYAVLEGRPSTLNIESGGRLAAARPVMMISSSYTALASDYMIVACDPELIVRLPAASALSGHRMVVKNVSTGPVSVDSAGGMLDGTRSKTLATPQSALTVESDGTNWLIVAQVGEIQ